MGTQRVLPSVTNAPLDEIKLKMELDVLFTRESRCAAWNAFLAASPY